MIFWGFHKQIEKKMNNIPPDTGFSNFQFRVVYDTWMKVLLMNSNRRTTPYETGFCFTRTNASMMYIFFDCDHCPIIIWEKLFVPFCRETYLYHLDCNICHLQSIFLKKCCPDVWNLKRIERRTKNANPHGWIWNVIHFPICYKSKKARFKGERGNFLEACLHGGWPGASQCSPCFPPPRHL